MKIELKCRCGASASFVDGDREYKASSLADEWLRNHTDCPKEVAPAQPVNDNESGGKE